MKIFAARTTRRISSVFAAAAVSCLLIGQQVQANSITGTIGFAGIASASVVGDTTTITPGNPWITLGGFGDFSGVSGALATFSPIVYTGTGTGATLTSPVLPLWTFTIGSTKYSFDLLSLTSGTVVTGWGGITSVALSGMGVAHITGLSDTYATWSLSGTGPSAQFTIDFSTATAGGTGVPDAGSTIALLGLAVLGLQGLRRGLSK